MDFKIAFLSMRNILKMQPGLLIQTVSSEYWVEVRLEVFCKISELHSK